MVKNYFTLLCLLILFKAAVVIWFIASGSIGLGPDEAQYWTWSQQLAWGYYSKPPGIAWQIKLGTLLFGNTELGVRFGAVLIGTLLPIAVYYLGKACKLQPSTCFWAGVMMALTPLGLMSTFLAITDGGLALFWTLACIAICRDKGPLPFYTIGFVILCGALFKWPIYYLWIFVFVWVLIHRELFSKHLFGGILLSLLGLLPSFIWNMQHDWATFRHVTSTIHNPDVLEVGTTELMRGNFWDFVGAQALLLSPILIILLILGYVRLFKERNKLSYGLQFCGWTSFIVIVVYTSIALFKKMQGNWCDFVYPSAIVLIAWYACERMKYGRYWVIAGLILSVILTAIFASIPKIQSQSLFAHTHIPYKLNPFKHNLGWDKLRQELQDVGYDPKQHFLFGDKYQTSSILSFYGPGQKRAYFLNLHGIRKNQFSYWLGMESEQVGNSGYFVLTENSPALEKGTAEIPKEYQKMLEQYFGEVRFLGLRPLWYSYGSMVKGAYIFKCIDYNGKLPSVSEIY